MKSNPSADPGPQAACHDLGASIIFFATWEAKKVLFLKKNRVSYPGSTS